LGSISPKTMPLATDLADTASAIVEAPPKRFRRSTSDLIREQKLRQAFSANQSQRSLDAGSLSKSEALVAAPIDLTVAYVDPISSQVPTDDRVLDSTKSFQAAEKGRVEHLELAAEKERQQTTRPTKSTPCLQTSEDLSGDLSIKTSIRLTTPHGSFAWLRRLPAVLRSQAGDAMKGPARDLVLAMCKDSLPKLMTDPDKALLWMERIANCLTWYQLEGPSVPTAPLTSGASLEERLAWRRVEEWDEAFRSLHALLRQGLVSTYAIVSERFAVIVCGQGSGPWTSSRSNETQRPTHAAPCAVLCPSVDELRRMLQENHVSFEVAEIASQEDPAPPSELTLEEKRIRQEQEAEEEGSKTQLAIPFATEPPASSMEQIRSDLRELRRIGEKVVTPDEQARITPLSSALWFEGAWRVHGLLDVLRQHFLVAPLPGAPPSATRLPRLVAPTTFCHASVKCAEVLKTQTVKASGTPGTPDERVQHIAELSGNFFPGQVRRLLELLRVLLPSFECNLVTEQRHCVGINAFTQLGMHHVEAVKCESAGSGLGGTLGWMWEFKLGT